MCMTGKQIVLAFYKTHKNNNSMTLYELCGWDGINVLVLIDDMISY